ncbi:MAG: GyrI-like domain-containing protein [Firmicutes bacterium]|nr:GyrI-like domain-containing protein [Bacillota bacterium]
MVDKTKPITDKSNFAYSIMIRQPDFLTDELFEQFKMIIKKKKNNVYIDKLKYATISEGLCCQMLHLGSYDDESVSFEIIKQFCIDNGFERTSMRHREIYLSDPHKTEALKLKTVLRYTVKKT